MDNRVGEALLLTPLIETLASKYQVEVIVHERCGHLLEGHSKVHRVHRFNRKRLWMGAWAPGVAALRRENFDAVVNCANWEVPSVTGAVVSRLVANRGLVVGPSVGIAGKLMDVAVEKLPGTESEIEQRLHLLSPFTKERIRHLSFRPPRISAEFESYLQQFKNGSYAVVNPGGRLDWRRVPTDVFGAACRHLVGQKRVPIVTYGPGEEELAKAVVALAPGSFLAPRTSLDELAALMQTCNLTLCNNTGPMHLSVAVGAKTIALFLNMPSERWGYRHAPHQVVELSSSNSLEEMIEIVTRNLQQT